MNIRWVIQSNLLNAVDHDRMVGVCKKHGYSYESVKVVPFTPDLPSIPADTPTVFYGGTNFINTVHLSGRWNPGAFFNDDFSIKTYLAHYGSSMLCHPCVFTTFREFSTRHRSPDELFFVRPDRDLKMFAGEVMDFNRIVMWERRLRHMTDCSKHPGLTPDTEIVVSEPCNIAHEWRLFIVGGKVSSGSHYRSYMALDVKDDLPARVKDFAEGLCRVWTPADVFVMDVGESAGNLYVIECNCFNSAGFYASDVEKIMIDVSGWCETTCPSRWGISGMAGATPVPGS